MPSLNVLQPEQVSHGSEITIQVQLTPGAYVTLAECYEINFDEDQTIVAVPLLGTRRTGYRQGRYKITGSLKAYWINSTVRSFLVGNAVTLAGSSTVIYHSQRPFNRYNINVSSSVVGAPNGQLINAVFEKDALKWSEAALAEETVNFTAEDWLGI